MTLPLEPIFVKYDDRGEPVTWERTVRAAMASVRWLHGDCGRITLKSSSLMFLCGMAGNIPVGVWAERGFGFYQVFDRSNDASPPGQLARPVAVCLFT